MTAQQDVYDELAEEVDALERALVLVEPLDDELFWKLYLVLKHRLGTLDAIRPRRAPSTPLKLVRRSECPASRRLLN